MVSAELTAKLPKTMTAGWNEQVKVLGSPEHSRVIDEGRVLEFGVAVTVTLPEPPGASLIFDGLVPGLRLRLAELPAQVEVYLTEPDIWFLMEGFPMACTYST